MFRGLRCIRYLRHRALHTPQAGARLSLGHRRLGSSFRTRRMPTIRNYTPLGLPDLGISSRSAATALPLDRDAIDIARATVREPRWRNGLSSLHSVTNPTSHEGRH